MLATQAQLDGARDLKGLLFIVHEDDDTTCTIKDSSDALDSSIAAVETVDDGKDAITDEDRGNLLPDSCRKGDPANRSRAEVCSSCSF